MLPILLFTFVFGSCSVFNSNRLRCPGKSAYKHKKYRIKKSKGRNYPIYSASNSSSRSSAPENQAAEKTPENKSIPQQTPISQPIQKNTDQSSNSQPIADKPKPISKTTTAKTIPKPQIKQSVEPISVEKISGENTNLKAKILKYNPKTQLVFKGKVYQRDETIVFNEKIKFIPNYSVYINDSIAYSRLQDLVDLLKQYPEKEVIIISHAGWDASVAEDLKDKQLNPITGQEEKILYGRGPEVYSQIIFVNNMGQLELVKERDLPDISLVRVSDILRERAKLVEETLIEKFGINKGRIRTALGAFERLNEHIVEFKIE